MENETVTEKEKFETGTVRTEKFEMDYARFGNGSRYFVIFPGVSTEPVVPMASIISMNFALFTEDYTVYLFDRKRNIEAGYDIWQMAEDAAEAMKILGITNADIFGASQGGQIAMALALKHPEIVHALYLGSTAAKPNEVSLSVMSHWIKLIENGSACELMHDFNTKIYSEDYYNKYQNIFAELEAKGENCDLGNLYHMLNASKKFDVYDEIEKIKCPIFAVGSVEDKVLTGEATVEIAEKTGCHLYMYEGFGHAVFDEAPDYRKRMLAALRSVR